MPKRINLLHVEKHQFILDDLTKFPSAGRGPRWAQGLWKILERVNKLAIRRSTPLKRGVNEKVRLCGATLVLFAICFSIAGNALAGTPTFKITGLQTANGNAIVSWQGGGTLNQVQYRA